MTRKRNMGRGRAAATGYTSWPLRRWYTGSCQTASAILPYSETMMRFYTQQHRFYAGIDLHARSLHLCVLDHNGAVLLDRGLPCHFPTLLEALAPFRDGLV